MIRSDDLEILSQHPAAVEALVEGLRRATGKARHFDVKVSMGPQGSATTTAKLVDGDRIESFQGRRPKGKTA
jgi:hypothetical protein